MKDKQLKDMCILLGIQLPAETYDSIEERLAARKVKPGYEPKLEDSYVAGAEQCAKVVEAAEKRGKEPTGKLGTPLDIALNNMWKTVEFLTDFCYMRGQGYTDSKPESIVDIADSIGFKPERLENTEAVLANNKPKYLTAAQVGGIDWFDCSKVSEIFSKQGVVGFSKEDFETGASEISLKYQDGHKDTFTFNPSGEEDSAPLLKLGEPESCVRGGTDALQYPQPGTTGVGGTNRDPFTIPFTSEEHNRPTQVGEPSTGTYDLHVDDIHAMLGTKPSVNEGQGLPEMSPFGGCPYDMPASSTRPQLTVNNEGNVVPIVPKPNSE